MLIRRGPDGWLVVDRSGSDPHGTHVALPATPPIPLPEGPVDIVVLEDHGLLEIFLAGGTVAVTMQTFKHDGPVRLTQQA